MEKVINGVSCRVVEKEWDVYFDMALTMFEEIVKNNQAGKPSVFIVPVGPTDQYPILAKLINSQRVSLKNVHFFNMDEYLVSPTQWISEDDPMSFHGRMKREFYDRVDESLVMPESQRHFPEPGHEKEYDELIAGLGGVDMCFGGLGINGHVAFNEAAEADDPITADAYADLETRVLPISRETRAVNAFGYQRGDLAGMPEWCITVGMKQILSSEKVYRAEPPMAERAAEACAAWENGSPVAGFSASQTARRALLHDGGYRTGDRVSNKKCSILFEWNIFIAILRGYCHKNGKNGLLFLLRRILRLAVVFFQQQNKIPHDEDNAAPKHDDAKKQNLDAGGVGAADDICLNDFCQHVRKKQQSGAVQNNTVSDLRGFVLFAHGVSLLRFCTRIRYF